ncbi:hypothetical protein [Segeticoccus rhizosphaerae]|uniref:hypothetical protein n=1 Tax=Segeticoccus rhizosphaerae TaxID=1104777 RepID=UPI0012654D80|nr:hypothetical protein [Segeticoccus rhizosphaerae]
MPNRVQLAESRPLAEASTGADSSGKMLLQLISPGWGSSGYYSAEVLQAAADAKIFPSGTHAFLDHPGYAEAQDRPERSVRDLAAVLAEDAHWDDTLQALVAQAQVFAPYRTVLDEMKDAIGVSIRAYATAETGKAEGRTGPIITSLTEGISTDFVTSAGRGGKILAVLESARTAVSEAPSQQTSNRLSDLVRATYADTEAHVYSWLRDYDPEAGIAWFTIEQADDATTYQQSYELDEDDMPVLTGDRVEVVQRVEWVPVQAPTAATEGEPAPTNVPAPAGQQETHTQESEEDTMPQIEEARLRQLEEDAGRVQTLESERDAAVTERDQARTERDQLRAREAARPAVTARVGQSTLPARQQARIVESVLSGITIGEDGSVDTEAVVAATEAAVTAAEADLAELVESLGVGQVTGFGRTASESTGYTVEDFDKAFAATSQEG